MGTTTPTIRRLARLFVTVLVLAIVVAPLYWLIATALKLPLSIGQYPPALVPRALTASNFGDLFRLYSFPQNLANSAIVTVSAVLLTVTIGSLAGYAVAHLPQRGRRFVLFAVLLFGLFPEIMLIPGLFATMRDLGWLNTWQSLILPYSGWGLPFAIWMSANYFATLPPELEEAARVDGAGWVKTVWSVILPVSGPALVAVAVFTFVADWSEFLMANSVDSTLGTTTLPVGITLYGSQYYNATGSVFAAALLGSIPVAVLLVVFRKLMVSGLVAGTVR